MQRIAIGLAVLVLASPSAWAVHKCVGADGRVVFQDRPCADGSGSTVAVQPATPAPEAAAALDAQVRLQRLKQQGAIAEAVAQRRPMVGMSTEQLRAAMGEPTRINANNYRGRLRDQLVYERDGETWYVYTEDGFVDSIQNRPRIARAGSDKRCPSAAEIRDMETRASSITLSTQERASMRRLIDEMKRCRP